jgi:diguanylate cyclase (GGDEF)-like protein
VFGHRPLLFRVTDYLRSRPRHVTVALIFSLLAGLGLIDYWTGIELAVSVFYLVPIALAAWVLGGRWTMSFAALATVIWFWADIAGGNRYEAPFIPYWNAAMRFAHFVVLAYLLAFVRKTLDSERALSRTDALTGALNKLAFRELAEYELGRMRRYPHPLSIAYIDLDNFKQMNDRHGHAAGDALLVSVVATLHKVMRQTDFVTRLGGDEFVVVMVETSPEAAQRAFIKAQASLLTAMRKEDWPVTFSIGVVTFLEAPASVEEMLEHADKAMYRAKRHGKNRVVYEVVSAPEAPRPTLHRAPA